MVRIIAVDAYERVLIIKIFQMHHKKKRGIIFNNRR